MESLITTSDRLVQHTSTDFIRYLYSNIAWNNRLVGIIGAKGTGKSTLLLQHIKLNFPDKSKALYVSLDNIWFTKHSLSELAEDFYNLGGTHLFLDEVHKYQSWAMEIKNIYDSYPTLRIVFTGSSMLEIFNASIDFSRRVVVYELKGLSFREFLKYDNQLEQPVFELSDILKNHRTIASEITSKIKILPELKKYLEYGYYPYYKENIATYPIRVEQSIYNTVHYGTESNTSKLAKPQKVYLENTNIINSLAFQNANTGNVRETFFANQLRTKYRVNTAQNGDFMNVINSMSSTNNEQFLLWKRT